MRDPGLERAIQAAGGIPELALRINTAEPVISTWSQIPAAHVLLVEAATGVSRTILRPDIYSGMEDQLDGVDAARAQEYALLAVLLARPPDAALLKRVAALGGDESALGAAHAALAEAAADARVDKLAREYFHLFIGIGRGELLPYASYYLTGALNQRPLARLRADLMALGIERTCDQSEPEDHAAVLFEIMAGLIDGRLPAAAECQKQIFDKHLAPWIGAFFADLSASKAADFYRHVASLGHRFIDIETKAYAMPT